MIVAPTVDSPKTLYIVHLSAKAHRPNIRKEKTRVGFLGSLQELSQVFYTCSSP